MWIHIFKPKRKHNGKTIVSRTFYGRYKLDSWPSGKYKQVSLGVTDKRAAEKKLAEIVEIAEKEELGILPKRTVRDAAFVKLTDHLEDYISDCKVRKLSRDYIKRSKQRIMILLGECRWVYAKDVSAGSFIEWRAKKTHLTPKTLNDYKTVISTFLEWLRDTDRIEVNPIKDRIKPLDTKGNESFQRRALGPAEILSLLAVSGRRKIVYMFALYTGLRRGEISKLLFGDVFLDTPTPYVRVKASITKNGKEAFIPLHSTLAAELRDYMPDNAGPGKKLFSRLMPNRETVKNDFAKAGIAIFDPSGRKVDFHALRHTFITNINMTGVAPRIAMEAARHSDQRLTDRIYTDVSKLPVRDAIEKLPNYLQNNTKNDAQIYAQTLPNDAQNDAQTLVAASLALSQTDTETLLDAIHKTLENNGLGHEKSQLVTNWLEGKLYGGGGNRTPVPR